jgi:oxalate decarboxylase
MTRATRRAVLDGLAFATIGLAYSQTFAAPTDGHAAGYDVAPAARRRIISPLSRAGRGDPMKFTSC